MYRGKQHFHYITVMTEIFALHQYREFREVKKPAKFNHREVLNFIVTLNYLKSLKVPEYKKTLNLMSANIWVFTVVVM